MQSTGARKVIPISREFESDDRYTTRLSVGHGTGEWIGGARAVVTYQGGDDCSGAWSCSKDGRGACAHIRAGRKWLLRALNPGKGGEDGDDDEFFQGMDARKIHAACGRHDADVHEVSAVRKAAKDDGAISYLDVLPPHWAELPSDKEGSTYYPRPPPVRKPGDVPDLLRLEAHSSRPIAHATVPGEDRTSTPPTRSLNNSAPSSGFWAAGNAWCRYRSAPNVPDVVDDTSARIAGNLAYLTTTTPSLSATSFSMSTRATIPWERSPSSAGWRDSGDATL